MIPQFTEGWVGVIEISQLSLVLEHIAFHGQVVSEMLLEASSELGFQNDRAGKG